MTKALLFDFDGVLVNTATVWYDIHKKHNPDLEYSTFQEMSTGNFIEKSEGGHAAGTFVLGGDINTRYIEKLQEMTTEEALRELIKNFSKDHKIFIVSSGSESTIGNYLKSQGIAEHFSGIFGHEFHTSKEEKIKHILRTHQIEPHMAIMITDTSGDILEAKPTGAKTIGVLWGLHDDEMLALVRPDKIVKTPVELAQAIEELLQ